MKGSCMLAFILEFVLVAEFIFMYFLYSREKKNSLLFVLLLLFIILTAGLISRNWVYAGLF